MLKKTLLSAAVSLTLLSGAIFSGTLFSGDFLSTRSYADTPTSTTKPKGSDNMETQMTPQQTDVLSLIQKMTANFEQGNLDVVMSTYEKDAAIMFEPGTPVTNAAVSKQIFAEWKSLNPKFSYNGHEVIIVGDLAVHIAPWSMVGKTPDGQEISQSGLSVAVLRQQEDGAWKMVIDNPHGDHLLNN